MTEEEAKGKWCPFVRMRPDGYAADMKAWPPEVNCIGSACMMWRWSASPADVEIRNRVAYPASPVKATGHCGLAGKP